MTNLLYHRAVLADRISRSVEATVAQDHALDSRGLEHGGFQVLIAFKVRGRPPVDSDPVDRPPFSLILPSAHRAIRHSSGPRTGAHRLPARRQQMVRALSAQTVR